MSPIAVGDQFVIVFDYKSEKDANCLQICLEEIEGSGGAGTGGGSSATTGETLPIVSAAVAGLVFATALVVLKKKTR